MGKKKNIPSKSDISEKVRKADLKAAEASAIASLVSQAKLNLTSNLLLEIAGSMMNEASRQLQKPMNMNQKREATLYSIERRTRSKREERQDNQAHRQNMADSGVKRGLEGDLTKLGLNNNPSNSQRSSFQNRFRKLSQKDQNDLRKKYPAQIKKM